MEVASGGEVTRPTTPLGTSPVGGGTLDLTAGASVTNFLDDELTGISTTGKTVTRTGTKFVVKARPQANTTQIQKAVLTVLGNETGGFKTIIITVDPTNFLTLDVESTIRTQ